MREGASVGVHVVISGDRTLLLGRISTLSENKMAFQLSDPSDLTLIGLNPRKVPAKMPPGRGFRAQGAVETHVALLADDPSGQAQSAALATIGQWANGRWADVPRNRRPFRVDVLPNRISFEEAWALRDTSDRNVASPLWALTAVGGDQLLAIGPNLSTSSPAFVIGGPPRSGRSTALLTMTRSLLSVGTQVILAAPRRQSPLRRLKNAPGVVGYFAGEDISEDEMRQALDRVQGPAAIIVDDAEILRQCDATDVLTSVVRRSTGKDVGIVIAGDADDICGGFSGWQVEMKKARSGLLLSPQNLSDADLIGVRLQRGSIGNAVQPGRGLLHLGDGEVRTVQVPLTAL